MVSESFQSSQTLKDQDAEENGISVNELNIWSCSSSWGIYQFLSNLDKQANKTTESLLRDKDYLRFQSSLRDEERKIKVQDFQGSQNLKKIKILDEREEATNSEPLV